MPDLSPVSDAPVARREWSASSTQNTQQPPARVYLDHGASTPCDPAAAALMEHVAVHEFASPSSSHRAGQHAAHYIETAREQVAAAVGALPEEIVFTSGATESNNLAILGMERLLSESTPDESHGCG